MGWHTGTSTVLKLALIFVEISKGKIIQDLITRNFIVLMTETSVEKTFFLFHAHVAGNYGPCEGGDAWLEMDIHA